MIDFSNLKSNEKVVVYVTYYDYLSEKEKSTLDIIEKTINLKFTKNENEADLILSRNNKKNESIRCKEYDPIDHKPGLVKRLNVNLIVNICKIAHNVYFYDDNNKEYVICNYSLKKILCDEKFSALFLRVSKENVINVNKIKNVIINKNNKIEVRLVNGNIVFVNNTYKKDFMNVYCEKSGYVI